MSESIKTVSVQELVSKFERWETSKEKICRETASVANAGQVSRVKQSIEDRLKHSVPLRFSRKGSKKTKMDVRYVEETNEYYIQDENGEWKLCDESELLQTPHSSTTSTDREMQSERTTLWFKNIDDTSIKKDAKFYGIPVEVVQNFTKGVRMWVFVKENHGMLKPVLVRVRLSDEGQIWIARFDKIQYVTMKQFSAVDYSTNCLDFLRKSTLSSLEFRNALEAIEPYPKIALWTKPIRSEKGKSLCCVAKNKEVMDTFYHLIERLVKVNNIKDIQLLDSS